jgi:nitrate reductase NapAB chaperone NapD
MLEGIIITLLVLIITGLVLKYMQLAKIVMVVEDELSQTVDALENVEDSLEGFLALKLYFDNQELQAVVTEAKNDVSLAKVSVTRLIERFVEFSKEKYVVEEVDEVDQALKTIARYKRTTRRLSEDDLQKMAERMK